MKLPQDEKMHKWINDLVAKNAPRMEASDFFTAIVSRSYIEDPECALQMGLMVLMDKPITLLVKSGTTLPKSLVKVASVIEYFDNGDDIPDAMQRLMKKATELDL